MSGIRLYNRLQTTAFTVHRSSFILDGGSSGRSNEGVPKLADIRVCRAQGSSIISGPSWSGKSSLGPTSSCSIILMGCDEALLRVVAVVVVVVVVGVVGVCGCRILSATIILL
jgi:hypothetical protein